MSVIYCLCCHNAGVPETQPVGERNQAAMLGRITTSRKDIITDDRGDPADDLQVVLPMAAVPLPSRRPNEAERVDGEEDCADCNQGNFEEFFTRDVVHVESPVRKTARTGWASSEQRC